MNLDKNKRRAMLSWLFVSALFALCGVLGVLQYRWIGEVSVAARERLRGSLQANLDRLSQDFDSEIASACRALLPATPQAGAQAAEAEVAVRYELWKKTLRHGRIFRRLAIAAPQNDTAALRGLDLESGAFSAMEWPANWKAIKDRLESRPGPGPWQDRSPPRPPSEDQGLVFQLPLLRMPPPGAGRVPFGMPRPGTPSVPFGREKQRG